MSKEEFSFFLLMRFWCYSTVKSRFSFLFFLSFIYFRSSIPLETFLGCNRNVEITQFYSHTLWNQQFASDWVEHHFIEHWSNSNIERVHLLVIELEHPIFGFERTNIEPNKAFTKFTKLLIELTRTSFFQISNVFIYWKSNSNTLFLPSNIELQT